MTLQPNPPPEILRKFVEDTKDLHLGDISFTSLMRDYRIYAGKRDLLIIKELERLGLSTANDKEELNDITIIPRSARINS